MSDKDPPANPFAAFESDRTIIKPSAGRGPRAAEAPAPAAPTAAGWGAAPPPPPPQAGAAPDGSELPPYASLNPLVQAAAPLLAAAPRLPPPAGAQRLQRQRRPALRPMAATCRPMPA